MSGTAADPVDAPVRAPDYCDSWIVRLFSARLVLTKAIKVDNCHPTLQVGEFTNTFCGFSTLGGSQGMDKGPRGAGNNKCWRSDQAPWSAYVRGRRVIMTNYQEISFTVRHRLELTLSVLASSTLRRHNFHVLIVDHPQPFQWFISSAEVTSNSSLRLSRA